MRDRDPNHRTERLNIPFLNSENASSIALAGLLMFALVFTVYTAVQVQYVPEWKTDAEYAHMNEVWADMGKVKNSVDSLTVLMDSNEAATEAGTSISVPISMGGGHLPVVGNLKSGGTLSVNEESCSVEIDFFDDSAQDEKCDCGTVTYLSDNNYYLDQVFGYENGALILEQDDHYSMKLTPSFLSIQKGNNKSDIYLNPVIIQGKTGSISGNTRGGLKLSAKNFIESESTTTEGFRITINTRYPETWENYLDITSRNAGLKDGEDYEISSTPDSVIFAYLNMDKYNITVHCRKSIVDAEVVVGDEDNSAWEYDEEDLILPVADFTANRTNGIAPLPVKFTDKSENADTRHWDFGDGSSSKAKNPAHTFTSPGTYTVELTATNENGTDSKSIVIDVSEAPKLYPVADFTANITAGNTPLTVQFTDLSTNAATLAWDFDGDGTVDSTERKPVYTYTGQGSYTINLTVSNANGTDTESRVGYITVSEASLMEMERWYPFTHVTGPDSSKPLIIEDLQYPDGSADLPAYTEGVDVLLDNYGPNETAYHDFGSDNNLDLTFDFANDYSGFNGTPRYVTIRMVYRIRSNLNDGSIEIAGENPGNFNPQQGYSWQKWYLFNRTVEVEDLDEVSDLIFDLNLYASGGGNREIEIDYLAVYLSEEAPSSEENQELSGYGDRILLNKNEKGGIISSGTYIQLKNNGKNNEYWVEIDWKQEKLKKDDVIKLVIDGDQSSGTADMSGNQITNFNFDVKLYINDKYEKKGKVSNIWITGYSDFESTLRYEITPHMSGTNLKVDGKELISWSPHDDSAIRLYNISPSPSNNNFLRIDFNPGKTYFDCSGNYEINEN